MYKKYFKRLVDLLLSFILVVLALPLFISISVALFLLQRKIFFVQSRPGFHGQSFKIFKFKTMNDKTDHHKQLLSDQERITVLGKFLRKTNLDELPQLFNVLFGTMSLIGPRPFLSEYMNLYDKNQQRRHLAKPGLTGWAQINGGNMISWEKKLQYDLEYVDKQSLVFDLKIILITISRILTLQGFDTGSIIPPKFEGNVSSLKIKEEESANSKSFDR